MMQTITASVGRLGGANRPGDVRTIQELLNRIPPAAGGPCPLLAVDSVCGASTVDAIEKFQVRQLGSSRADGLVDPIGPTLQKLNQLGGTPGSLRSTLLTPATRLRCPHGGTICVTPKGNHPLGPEGSPVLRSTDDFQVIGCPRADGCTGVNWVIASDPLLASSIAVCMNAAGAPLGKVRIG